MPTMSINNQGYVRVYPSIRKKDGRDLLHRVIAENVLGHPISSTIVIHHVDGNRSNNVHSNLVICQNAAYHRLLHKRQVALAKTGNANLRKCCVCGLWKHKEEFWKRAKGKEHSARCKNCTRKLNRDRYRAKSIAWRLKHADPTLP